MAKRKDQEAPIPDATIDLGELPNTLGFLLRLGQISSFENFYRLASEKGLKPGEFSVLYLIGRNARIRQGALATQLRIKRAHMTKLIRQLEAQGYVQRDIPDNDRRSVELSLTKSGEAHVKKAEPIFFSIDDNLDQKLTDKEHDELMRLLRKLNNLGDENGRG